MKRAKILLYFVAVLGLGAVAWTELVTNFYGKPLDATTFQAPSNLNVPQYISATGKWTAQAITAGSLPNHASRHQDGGADEISVTGLSGVLADGQPMAVYDEGVLVGTRPKLNIIGAGATAMDNAGTDAVDITIPGGGGGGAGTLTIREGTVDIDTGVSLLVVNAQQFNAEQAAANEVTLALVTGGVTNTSLGADAVTADKVLDGTLTDADVNAANKDGAAGTASLRTLGTAAGKAAAGTHAAQHQSGGADEVATVTPGSGAIPKANASSKIPEAWLTEELELEDASDVTMTGAATHHILVFNNTAWVNAALAGDVTGSLSGNTYTLTIGASKVVSSMIFDGTVALADLANLATKTTIGRNTGSTGVPEAVTAEQVLDWIGTPAQGDILYRNGTATVRLAAGTVGRLLRTGGASANPTWADAPMPLVSGGYVTRSGSNLLFLPDRSNRIYCYENSVWTEKTIADAGVTEACTGLTNSTVYYLYSYDSDANGTADELELVTTAPTTQNGIAVKTGATSRTLVARCRTNASGAVVTYAEDASRHFVCNEYNRRPIPLYVQCATDSWTYQSTSWTTVDSGATGVANRVEWYASGKDAVSARHSLFGQANGSAERQVAGIDLDGTSSNDAQVFGGEGTASAIISCSKCEYGGVPAEGYRFLQMTQRCTAAAALVTFYGDGGVTYLQTGMAATVWQ